MFAVILPGIIFSKSVDVSVRPSGRIFDPVSFSLLPNMQLSKNRDDPGHILPDPALLHCVSPSLFASMASMVDPVGLEPTTPALSRRCSNQLSYGSIMFVMDRALRVVAVVCGVFPQSTTKVEAWGFEPQTSSLQSWRSTN